MRSGYPTGFAAGDHSVEVRVAFEHEPRCCVACDLVGPGRRDDRSALRRSDRDRRSDRLRELVQEVWIRGNKLERHCARAIVGDDAPAEIAAGCSADTARAAADFLVEGRGGREGMEAKGGCALEPVAEICRSHAPSVGIVDATAQLEDIGSSAVAHGGQRCREIRDELRPVDAANALEGGQAVVRHAQDIEGCAVVAQALVEGVERVNGRDHPQRATTVPSRRRLYSEPDTAGSGHNTSGRLPVSSRVNDLVLPRVDPENPAAGLVADPQRAVGEGEVAWRTAGRNSS